MLEPEETLKPPPSDDEEFTAQNRRDIAKIAADEALQRQGLDLMVNAEAYRYSYHFRWLGRPVIQYPQDMIALQEIVWRVQPEVIVETGVARGGSIVFFASLLHLLGGNGMAIGVDIEIRPHNRHAIEHHPLSDRITLIEGSSTDEKVARRVIEMCNGKRTMVVLDSNHTHAHVLRELELYAPLVNKGSYLIVLDTVIEDCPPDMFPNRPWGPGDNPKTAVREFLARTDRFEIDPEMDAKLLLSVAPEGYLRCIRN